MHLDPQEQVAFGFRPKMGKPITFESEHGIGLCPSRHFDLHLAIKRGDLDLGPENRIDHLNRKPAPQINAMPLEA